MELTFTHKKHLLEQGYVVIPGAVPKLMVDQALKAINHSIGEGMPVENLASYRSITYCPELQTSKVITDLFNKTPARDLLGSVVDIEQIHPISSGQIALRFPGTGSKPIQAGPHLDGTYSPTNGMTKDVIQNFTALVAVLLSDVPSEDAGNFTVWPGTHRQYEQYFQEHGAESLFDGLPPVDMPEPVQITGKAGDVIIAQYTLAHSATPNISPNIRYAIFFRILHTDLTRSNWQQSMENIWMHWPGMQKFIEELG